MPLCARKILLLLLLLHRSKTSRRRPLRPGQMVQPARNRGWSAGGGFWVQSRKRQLLLLLAISQHLNEQNEPSSVRRWWVRPTFALRKQHGCWYTTIQNMKNNDPEKFFNHLRMTPERFDELVYLLGPHLNRHSIREPISPGERLAVTLRYLASGDSMISTSYNFLLGKTTISEIILTTCQVIWKVLGPMVFDKLDEEKWRSVAADFSELWQFPNCVGAIDGKHCVVQKFAGGASEYYNYKGTNSIVLLSVCDAKYKFLLVDIGARGRRSDGGVLQSSQFGKKLLKGELNIPPPCSLPNSDIIVPHVIVGDEAFPLTEQIMRPFPGQMLEDYKTVFNYRLSRARRTMENTYGIQSARWRILRKTVIASEKTANAIVQATVVLHNYLMKAEENVHPMERRYVPPGFVDSDDAQGRRILGRWRQEVSEGTFQPLTAEMRMGARNHTRLAQEIREDFVDYFIDAGQVPWQWDQLPRQLNSLE